MNINTPEHWDHVWDTCGSGYLQDPLRDSIYREILREIKAPSRIIDIGGGLSRFSSFALREGHSVYVVDFSREAVERLRQSGIRADVVDLRREVHLDEQFDVGVCTEVIEHLDDPAHLLQLAFDCAPRFFLSTPAPGEYPPSMCPDHVREYSKDDLLALLSRFYEEVTVWRVERWLMAAASTRRPRQL